MADGSGEGEKPIEQQQINVAVDMTATNEVLKSILSRLDVIDANTKKPEEKPKNGKLNY